MANVLLIYSTFEDFSSHKIISLFVMTQRTVYIIQNIRRPAPMFKKILTFNNFVQISYRKSNFENILDIA